MNVKNDLIFPVAQFVFGGALAFFDYYKGANSSRSLEVNLVALAVMGDSVRRLYQRGPAQVTPVHPVQEESSKLYDAYFSSREGFGLQEFHQITNSPDEEETDTSDEEEINLNEAYWEARVNTSRNVEAAKPSQQEREAVKKEPALTSRIYSYFCKRKVDLEALASVKEFRAKDLPQLIATTKEEEIAVPEFDCKTPLIKRQHKLRFQEERPS